MKKTEETYQPLNEITFREAAWNILKNAGEALHYTQITAIAIETGYWRKQDEKYIREHMYQAIKLDLKNKRNASLFVEVAPGTYEANPVLINQV
jgi:hypothetical protein